MAHELETVEGQTFFADSRNDAWHQLGQKVGHAMTAEEVMAASHLAGWNVRKESLVIPQESIITDEGVTTPPPIKVPDRFATVRTNPLTGRTEYLGVVGNKYEPTQNESSCDLLNTLTDESGAHFETGGSLHGGRQTFITMKLPHAMEIAGVDGSVDRTEWYLAALNSHDGSTAWRVILTPVRIVCANTQAWALSAAKSSFSIRHTSGANVRIAEVRAALGLAWQSIGTIDEEFKRLASVPFSVQEMQTFADEVTDVAKVDPSSLAGTRRQNASNAIVKLFVSSPTITNIAGTRFAAYNAVTEYVDHYAPVRGANGDEATARAVRAIRDMESANSLKATAFSVLRRDLVAA